MKEFTDDSLGFGLSKEEKAELTELIREGQQGSDLESDESSLAEEVRVLREKSIRLATMFLDMDRRMNLLYEILQLAQRKSEVMNHRIDSLSRDRRKGLGGGS